MTLPSPSPLTPPPSPGLRTPPLPDAPRGDIHRRDDHSADVIPLLSFSLFYLSSFSWLPFPSLCTPSLGLLPSGFHVGSNTLFPHFYVAQGMGALPSFPIISWAASLPLLALPPRASGTRASSYEHPGSCSDIRMA